MAFDVKAWSDYGVASVGGAAALVGLLFVAVSVNSAWFSSSTAHRGRAGQALVLFVVPLVTGILILIPGQSTTALGSAVLRTPGSPLPPTRGSADPAPPRTADPTPRARRAGRAAPPHAPRWPCHPAHTRGPALPTTVHRHRVDQAVSRCRTSPRAYRSRRDPASHRSASRESAFRPVTTALRRPRGRCVGTTRT